MRRSYYPPIEFAEVVRHMYDTIKLHPGLNKGRLETALGIRKRYLAAPTIHRRAFEFLEENQVILVVSLSRKGKAGNRGLLIKPALPKEDLDTLLGEYIRKAEKKKGRKLNGKTNKDFWKGAVNHKAGVSIEKGSLVFSLEGLKKRKSELEKTIQEAQEELSHIDYFLTR